MKDQHGVTTKVFVGCEVSHDLRYALSRSSSWKQAHIESQNRGGGLQEIKKEEQDYIGFCSERQELSLEEVKRLVEEMKTTLHLHCPEIDMDKLNFVLFPEIRIA